VSLRTPTFRRDHRLIALGFAALTPTYALQAGVDQGGFVLDHAGFLGPDPKTINHRDTETQRKP
jgi:hypothetical protein